MEQLHVVIINIVQLSLVLCCSPKKMLRCDDNRYFTKMKIMLEAPEPKNEGKIRNTPCYGNYNSKIIMIVATIVLMFYAWQCPFSLITRPLVTVMAID